MQKNSNIQKFILVPGEGRESSDNLFKFKTFLQECIVQNFQNYICSSDEINGGILHVEKAAYPAGQTQASSKKKCTMKDLTMELFGF